MDQQQLLQETHEMLKKLLELDAERKRESEAAIASLNERFKMPSFDSETPKEDDFLTYQEQRMANIQSDIEVLRKKDQDYKEAVLAEYQEQTRILTEILERLKK